ncbi:MAG: hypothetical protein H7066_15310 [Cytophagaceae bacterium]|nr:hypothetical protein [Gemmatimonadaceae bacterium]
MIAPKPKKVPDLIGLESELLRDALGAAAHDLGGIASALALRVDTLGPASNSEDRRALGAIAEEARTLGRQLRQLRGPRGGDLLAPSRPGTLLTWWPLVERFGRALLGRGLALEATLDDAPISPEQSHALTFAMLALARGLRERELPRPGLVSLTNSRDGNAVVVRMKLTGPAGETIAITATGDPWARYAREAAERGGVDITSEAPEVVFLLRNPDQ